MSLINLRSSIFFPLRGVIPVFLAFKEAGDARFFELAQVLEVGVAVIGLHEVQFLAGLELGAFPAAVDAFPAAALPHLTEGGPAVIAAGSVTAELYQLPEHSVALGVVLERGEAGDYSGPD